MPLLVDMENTLKLFAEAVVGGLPVEKCQYSKELIVHFDNPNGVPRFTYAKISNNNIQGIVSFARTSDFEGMPTFNIGYAVVSEHRRNGIASELVSKGIRELSSGLKSQGINKYVVEAGVDRDNVASQKVAEKALGADKFDSKDPDSGTPTYGYRAIIN